MMDKISKHFVPRGGDEIALEMFAFKLFYIPYMVSVISSNIRSHFNLDLTIYVAAHSFPRVRMFC